MPRPLSFDPIAEAARQWREHWGEPTVAPMLGVISIMRVYQLLISQLNAALEPHGLTFPRYEALMLLFYSREGALPLGKMSARLQVHQTSVTPLIDGLESAGLVRREPHPTDRRTTLAVITERGREVAAAATRTLNDGRFGTEGLDAEALDALIDVLERYRQGVGDL